MGCTSLSWITFMLTVFFAFWQCNIIDKYNPGYYMGEICQCPNVRLRRRSLRALVFIILLAEAVNWIKILTKDLTFSLVKKTLCSIRSIPRLDLSMSKMLLGLFAMNNLRSVNYLLLLFNFNFGRKLGRFQQNKK